MVRGETEIISGWYLTRSPCLSLTLCLFSIAATSLSSAPPSSDWPNDAPHFPSLFFFSILHYLALSENGRRKIRGFPAALKANFLSLAKKNPHHNHQPPY